MKIESNKNWTTCLRLNTGDGSPRVFLLNSHFLGSVPSCPLPFVYGGDGVPGRTVTSVSV